MELEEKDFIQEEYRKHPVPFWFWFILLTVVTILLLSGRSWLASWTDANVISHPFLQVTNREFSLFLWQHPQYMRVHAKKKVGYLPDFQYLDKVTVEPELADRYVKAPPELIFLYHTWHRIIGEEFASRSILPSEFRIFLGEVEEWQPKYWSKAPSEYVLLVNHIPGSRLEEELPKSVQRALQGWKNYFQEGSQINQIKPTFRAMQRFLEIYPGYARHHWRNVLLDTFPDYLKTLSSGVFEPDAAIPEHELAPFLKVAFFNAQL